MIYVNISLAAFCFVICLIILLFVVISEGGKGKRGRIFIRMVTVNLFLLAASAAFFVLNSYPNMKSAFPLIATECLKAACGPILLILFVQLVMATLREKTTVSSFTVKVSRIAIAACVVDIATIIAEPSLSLFIYLDENNQLVRHDWFFLSYIFLFTCVAIIMGIIISHRKNLRVREFLTLIAYVAIPIFGVAVHMFIEGLPINFLSITLAVMLYFAGIQSELSEQIRQKELELTENKFSIMLSQIQPHFLYNALTAIAHLCGKDPEKAKKATVDFSSYLRRNMESLNDKGLVSLQKELNHTQGYLDLENVIYGSGLNVVYHIETDDFQLPPLTIQPIVENAVKHGIGKKESGGTVTVSVCETENEFTVTVSDDGAGYDAANTHQDNRKHIGIENVRRRVEEQCGGTLKISSEIGKGTTAVIAIPKIIS